MKLHLGCGNNYKEGWVNVDFVGDIADVHADLCMFPWPWEDNSVDEVFMEHVIEHFDRPEFVLKEIHRVLRPGGIVHMITPHMFSVSACSIDHKSFMSRVFFKNFIGPKDIHYWPLQNNGCWFEEVSYRVKIIKQPFIQWTPFDWIASRFPFFWEKTAFGIFRPTEISWIGRKPLDSSRKA